MPYAPIQIPAKTPSFHRVSKPHIPFSPLQLAAIIIIIIIIIFTHYKLRTAPRLRSRTNPRPPRPFRSVPAIIARTSGRIHITLPLPRARTTDIPLHQPPIGQRKDTVVIDPLHAMHDPLRRQQHRPYPPKALPRIVIPRREIMLQSILMQQIRIDRPKQHPVPRRGSNASAPR